MLYLLLILLLLLAATYYCYREVFWVRRSSTRVLHALPRGEQYETRRGEMLAMISNAAAIPCETVQIRSRDGKNLTARCYLTNPDAPVQIQFHGYRSNPLRDLSGGLPLALECGCNVLLVDQRAHGSSGGRCLSFGILERLDCLDWIGYARERFGSTTPIYLVGVSMGAATVLMASALELPDNVRGIIADCGYTSPRDIIREVMRQRHFPLFPVYPLVRLSGLIWGGFDIEAASAREALQHCRVPVLLIHGEDDRFVPCRMSRENQQACAAPCRLLTFPNAGHGLSYFLDRPRYETAVREFMEQWK